MLVFLYHNNYGVIKLYIVYGLLSALFASIATISVKKSLTNCSSILITFYKTIVMFLISVLFINKINVSKEDTIVLILSGITTTVSWIYYFKTMKETNIKNVVALDKLSTIITMILASLLLNEKFNILSVAFISIGIYLMLDLKNIKYIKNGLISVFFLSVTAVLSKFGIKDTNIFSATFIRNISILIIVTGFSFKQIKLPDKKTGFYVFISAIFTMMSWFVFYKGIKISDVAKVLTLEKLNIFFTILISNEKISRKEAVGLCLIIIGTIILIDLNF